MDSRNAVPAGSKQQGGAKRDVIGPLLLLLMLICPARSDVTEGTHLRAGRHHKDAEKGKSFPCPETDIWYPDCESRIRKGSTSPKVKTVKTSTGELFTTLDTSHDTSDNIQKPLTTSENFHNSAMELMLEYAKERNLTHCWLCQNLPKSMHSSMFAPIPFTLADYRVVNWNKLAPRLGNDGENCYSPAYPMDLPDYSRYRGVVDTAVNEINKHYLPVGINMCQLLRINSVQMDITGAFRYKMSLILVQTNCSEFPLSPQCVPQPFTPSVLTEVLLEVHPWFGSTSVVSVQVMIHNCSVPVSTKQTPLRDCSHYIPPIKITALHNVSLCFQGVGSNLDADLGTSDCLTVVNASLKRAPLPERVYLVCGDKAYSCMPHSVLHGVCYLAYLVPLIREVQTAEIAWLHDPQNRRKREISKVQQIAGMIIPSYGVYVSHKEIDALSKVLEKHLNASSRASLATNKELQEVKTVALQNRMALDLVLAAQGGTCKVIGTECCSYISDATSDVMAMVHDTAQGIKELHKVHGFDVSDFSGLLGSWGARLAKFLILIAIVLLVLVVLVKCIVAVIQCFLKRLSHAVVTQVPLVVVDDSDCRGNNEVDDPWIPPFESDNEMTDGDSWIADMDF